MNTLLTSAAAFALLGSQLFSAEPLPRRPENVSVRNEVQLAIDKGIAFLLKQQQPDGSFANPENASGAADHPALTALPLMALQREPTGKFRDRNHPAMKRAYDFIRSKAQPDGGIYGKGLSNYNTSICLIALLGSGNPKDEPLIAKAREFIIAQQASGMAVPELDGGIGYGPTGVSPKRQHPDLDNTLVSLEALRAYEIARENVELSGAKDLNWKAAIEFITRCQNLPEQNPKASTAPENRGGFVYYPGFSNADPTNLPADAKRPLRSYGTMTYAGLLSFIYADLKKDDPRVVAALDWLQKNYTLEENPGMAYGNPEMRRAGLFYYYHLMAKGLTAAGVDRLKTGDGKEVDWARDLALKLINLQNGDGSWVNDTARWMEKDPVLVTSYSLLALELIYSRL